MIKRNRFTNYQIIDIIQSFRPREECFGKGVPKKVVEDTIFYTNETIDQITDLFEDFTRNPEDYSALAYDTDKQTTVHIGPPLP